MGGSGSRFVGQKVPSIKGLIYSSDREEFMHLNARDKERRQQIIDWMDKTHKSIDDLFDEAQEIRFQDLQKNPQLMSLVDAWDVINSMSGMYQWFANEDSEVKPKIMAQILGRPEVLNASWSMAYHNYVHEMKLMNELAPGREPVGGYAWDDAKGGQILSFQKWLRTPMNMFRGGNRDYIKSDKFISYSASSKTAGKFDSFGGHKGIMNEKIRPIDTFGQFNESGEYEFLVPTWKLKGKG